MTGRIALAMRILFDHATLPRDWRKNSLPADMVRKGIQGAMEAGWECEITPVDASETGFLKQKILKRTDFDLRLRSKSGDDVNLQLSTRPSLTSDFDRVCLVHPDGKKEHFNFGVENDTKISGAGGCEKAQGSAHKIATQVLRQYQIPHSAMG